MFYITLEDSIILGTPTQQGSHSPQHEHLTVMFEDDGQTGYFYAIDMNQTDMPIVDALHVYNVENIDKENHHSVKICWDDAGNTALLLIDDIPLAAFDFAKLVGYNKTQLPEPAFASIWSHSALNQEVLTSWQKQHTPPPASQGH